MLNEKFKFELENDKIQNLYKRNLPQSESVLLKLLNILSNLVWKQYNQRLFELCKNFVKDEFQIFISIIEITEILHFSLVSESFVVYETMRQRLE